MAMLNSEATFRDRALEYGMEPEDIDRLVARGWGTFARFGFATS